MSQKNKKNFVLIVKKNSFLIGQSGQALQKENLKLKEIIREKECLQKNLGQQIILVGDILIFKNQQKSKNVLECFEHKFKGRCNRCAKVIKAPSPKTEKLATNLQKFARKKFSLDFFEGNLIKGTGFLLTIIVALQIIWTKGFHFIADLKSDVLGSQHAAAPLKIENQVTKHPGSLETLDSPKSNPKDLEEKFQHLYSEDKSLLFRGAPLTAKRGIFDPQQNNIVLTWNQEGEITSLNKFGRGFLGVNVTEIVGKSVLEFFPEFVFDWQFSFPQNQQDRLRLFLTEISSQKDGFLLKLKRKYHDGQQYNILWKNSFLGEGPNAEVLSIGVIE